MEGDYTSWLAAITATLLMLCLGRQKRMLDPKRHRMRCPSCGRLVLHGRTCPCTGR